MIYHANDVETVVKTIHGLLSEQGWFGVTTQYHDTFQSHMQIAHQINNNIPNHCTICPTAEQLLPLLKEQFSKVIQYDYINHIAWPTAEIAMQFSRKILSISMFNPDDNFYRRYHTQIEKIIARESSFKTVFKVSLFICKK